MKPYVNKIASNLKSPCPDGGAWELEIGQKTLLVGSNTSHKSSVIQSLELAFAGSADDIIGRSAVKDAALLLTLAPGDSLGVTGYLTDDTVATYLAKREEGRVKSPSHAGPGGEALVHRQVKSVMGGSTATQRKAFLRWASLGVQLEDILAQLPVEAHSVYKDLAEHLGHNATPVETLLNVIAYCEKRSRDLTKEIKGAQTVIDEVSSTMTSKPSQEDYDKLKAAVDAAQAMLEKSIQVHQPGGLTKHEMEKQVGEAQRAVDLWREESQRRADALDRAVKNLGERPVQAVHSLANLEWALENNLDNCPTCNSAVGNAHIQTCRYFYADTLEKWDQQNAVALTSIDEKKRLVEEAKTTFDSWSQELARLQSLVVVPEGEETVLGVGECRNRLAAARQALTATEIAASQWNQLITAKKKGESLLKDQDSYKQLNVVTNIAVGKVLTEQIDCFCANVTSYLPDGWDFRIVLQDGSSEVFRMGLMRDDRLHSALSGAEWAAVTTAIAMTVCDDLHPNMPVLLVPEDRAWDGTTLGAVMRSYSEFDGQVVIASTVKPTGRTPKGWTVIDMDETSAAWTKGTAVVETVEATEEPAVEEPAQPEVKTEPEVIIQKPKRRRRKVTKETAEIMANLGYTVMDIRYMSKQTAADIMQHSYGPDKVNINEDGTYTLAQQEMPPPPG